MSADLSFVLTVFDKAWALPRVWDRLRAQEGAGALEFVFVDDCSTDGSRTVLRDIAADDRRVRLLLGGENRGPAVRLNEGARAASGRLLYLIDGDDLAPLDAAAWATARLAESGARMLWGRRMGGAPARIGEAEADPMPDALAFCARRPVVHMAGVVERTLFLEAGGADEAVFIQDQSTPLRLGRAAGSMLWTEAGLAGEQEGPRRLSADRLQQHHDRFLSARRLLDGTAGEAREALTDLAVSALWKARRDGGPFPAHLSAAFARYLAAKLLGRRPDPATLDRWAAPLARLPGVRRPERTPERDPAA